MASKIKITNQELIPLSVAIFLLNPFFGIIFTFNMLFVKAVKYKSKLISTFVIFLSFFLAFINITKIPENDLKFHASQYLLAKNYTLINYLQHIEKEPLGYVFNYLMYFLSNGSIKFWVMTFSFFSYLLFFTSIKRFYTKLEMPTHSLVLSLVLAAFFPQLFSLSAHLIRQFIASSIFIYFAVDKILYDKNKWWLALTGILIHGSSLLLYVFIYFKFIGNFKKHKILNISLIILLLFYQSIAKILFFMLGGVHPAIDYILKRASQDTTYDLGGFQLLNFVLMLIMIVIVFFSTKDSYIKIRGINIQLEKNVKFFFFTMIILSFFILLNLRQSELSNRLFFYLFFYFPFVIPFGFTKIKQRAFVSYGLSIIFMVYFTYRLEIGVWSYASLSELGTKTFFGFLNYPEPFLEHKKYYW